MKLKIKIFMRKFLYIGYCLEVLDQHQSPVEAFKASFVQSSHNNFSADFRDIVTLDFIFEPDLPIDWSRMDRV